MFTGIIEEVGVVRRFSSGRLVIGCRQILEGTLCGDSISVNGVCLTVEKNGDEGLQFHVSMTTNGITGANKFHEGQRVNLERALTLEKRLGGHLVTGHVDGTVKIINMRDFYHDMYVEFLFRDDLSGFIVPKGSVSLDGISLTISEVYSSSFAVTMIPATYNSTNFQNRKRGDLVNIEIDLIARYLKSIMLRSMAGVAGMNGGL